MGFSRKGKVSKTGKRRSRRKLTVMCAETDTTREVR
jgi:hypothetical protein